MAERLILTVTDSYLDKTAYRKSNEDRSKISVSAYYYHYPLHQSFERWITPFEYHESIQVVGNAVKFGWS